MIERIARYGYFAVAPFVLFIVGTVIPIGGVVLNALLCMLIFLGSEHLEDREVLGVPLEKIFGKQLKFRNFYEENPPRSFWFYVFYPFLLPFMIFNKKARQELQLYRGYAWFNVVALMANNSYHYFMEWYPSIPISEYAPLVIAVLVLELLIVGMFVMPIITTIITYKMRGDKMRSLLLVGLVSLLFGVLGTYVQTMRPPPFIVGQRALIRERLYPAETLAVKQKALQAAEAQLKRAPETPNKHGFVQGEALTVARKELATFFQPVESTNYYLWASPELSVLILFGYDGGKEDNWFALSSEKFITKAPELPISLPSFQKASR